MTSANISSVGTIIGLDFDASSTSDTYGSGTSVLTNKGPMVWAKAGAAITEGQLCSLALSSGVLTASLGSTAGVGAGLLPVAVAHKDIPAASYGWFFTGPFYDVQVLLLTTIAANAAVTTTATPGSGGGGGTAVSGCVTNASSGSGGLTSCRATRALAVGSGA